MRKLIGILAALCLLTVFVSAASACTIDRNTGKCLASPDVKTINPTLPMKIDIKSYDGSSVSHADALSQGECAKAYSQTTQGQTTTGTYATAYAAASGEDIAQAITNSDSVAIVSWTDSHH